MQYDRICVQWGERWLLVRAGFSLLFLPPVACLQYSALSQGGVHVVFVGSNGMPGLRRAGIGGRTEVVVPSTQLPLIPWRQLHGMSGFRRRHTAHRAYLGVTLDMQFGLTSTCTDFPIHASPT